MIWRWTLNKTNFGPIAEFIGEGLSVLSLKRFGCSSLNYRLCVCHWGFISWVVKNFTNEMKWRHLNSAQNWSGSEPGITQDDVASDLWDITKWLRRELAFPEVLIVPPARCHQLCALAQSGHRQCWQSQPSPGAAQLCLCQYSCTHWDSQGFSDLSSPPQHVFCSLALAHPALL